MRSTHATLLAAMSALVMGGCGTGSTRPTSSQLVTASAGATLNAGAATLTIPPGALAHDTTVTLREADPHHPGRALRIEVEPHDALVGHAALLAARVTESNVRVKIHHGADDSLADVEVEDRNHHAFKTGLSTLGDVEIEVENGTVCSTACAAGQECGDGICSDHDQAARTCATLCAMGEECDDGACKTHDQFEMDHHGMPGACSPTCASGLTCHDGTCSAHD